MKQGIGLLVEDQTEVRDFFSRTISEVFPEIEIVTHPSIQSAQTWLLDSHRVQQLRFALIDLGLPDGSGRDVIRKIHQLKPSVLTVVITIYDDDARLFDALAAGASGYLLKDDSPAQIKSYLERIHQNEPPLSPSIARKLLTHFHQSSGAATFLSRTPQGNSDLTPRESETLSLIASGYTVPEAANQMQISAQTVAGYVKIIYQKLHVSNRAEATREAIRLGLVSERNPSAFI